MELMGTLKIRILSYRAIRSVPFSSAFSVRVAAYRAIISCILPLADIGQSDAVEAYRIPTPHFAPDFQLVSLIASGLVLYEMSWSQSQGSFFHARTLHLSRHNVHKNIDAELLSFFLSLSLPPLPP